MFVVWWWGLFLLCVFGEVVHWAHGVVAGLAHGKWEYVLVVVAPAEETLYLP